MSFEDKMATVLQNGCFEAPRAGKFEYIKIKKYLLRYFNINKNKFIDKLKYFKSLKEFFNNFKLKKKIRTFFSKSIKLII